MKINVFVIQLKDKILEAIGFDEASDTMLIHLPIEAVEYLKNNLDAWNLLSDRAKSNLEQGSGTYWGESEIYYLTGNYQDLSLYTKEIEINDNLLKKA